MRPRMRVQAGGREGQLGSTGRGSLGLVWYLESERRCRLVLHNTGREGEGGGMWEGREGNFASCYICLSLGGSSCHGTGWAGRGLLADSLP